MKTNIQVKRNGLMKSESVMLKPILAEDVSGVSETLLYQPAGRFLSEYKKLLIEVEP